MIEVIFERLIDIREDAELNQSEMAEILKTTQSNYSRWEKENNFIPISKLNLLCNYFNISMDYVIGKSRVPSPTKKIKLDKILIGNRLREFRGKFNLTQKELADFLNTSQSTISAYENGETLILTAFAYHICKTYDISMDWLCGRK